jgi:hypothetical protein
MPFGQSFFAYKLASKLTEGACRVFGADAEDAKMTGMLIGGSVAAGIAIATLDAMGGSATAADFATEAGRETIEARRDHFRDW